jgi:hypothetical protein
MKFLKIGIGMDLFSLIKMTIEVLIILVFLYLNLGINEFINKFIEEKNNDIAEKNKLVDQEIKQFYLIN